MSLISVCVALSSGVVFVKWKNKAHLYMFLSTLFGVLPTILFTFKVINMLWFVIILVVANVINFVLYKMFIKFFAKNLE